MLINYWNCAFADADCYDEEDGGRLWVYKCTHPDNEQQYCHLVNKYNGKKDECTILDVEIQT